jgi:SpoVK/Ycf46/Vps4 family AAA+-type ATPase
LDQVSSSVTNQSSQNTSTGTANEGYSWAHLGLEVVKFAVTIGLSYYLTKEALSMLKGALEQTSNKPSAQQATASKKALAKRLKRPEVETIEFGSYELRLLPDVLGSDEIEVSFDDIGGLDTQLEEVKDNVVLPIQLFHHGKSSKVLRGLTSCPTGVLLYGRPGTGKSLMAKAIARGKSQQSLFLESSVLISSL